jgi:hypothetical protein
MTKKGHQHSFTGSVSDWRGRLRRSLLARQAHLVLLTVCITLSVGLFFASGPIDRYNGRRSIGGFSMGGGRIAIVQIDGKLRALDWPQASRFQPQAFDGYGRVLSVRSRAVGFPILLFRECYQVIDEVEIILYQISESDEIDHPLMPDFSKISRQWYFSRGELGQSPYADMLPEIGAAMDRDFGPGSTLFPWLLEQDALPVSRISWPALVYNLGLVATVIVGVSAAIMLAATDLNKHRRRLREGRCPSCTYLLVGLADPRCPECGRGLSAEEWAEVQRAQKTS